MWQQNRQMLHTFLTINIDFFMLYSSLYQTKCHQSILPNKQTRINNLIYNNFLLRKLERAQLAFILKYLQWLIELDNLNIEDKPHPTELE